MDFVSRLASFAKLKTSLQSDPIRVGNQGYFIFPRSVAFLLRIYRCTRYNTSVMI